MLAAVVRLLSDASAVHACFVYLVEDKRERLVLRAASESSIAVLEGDARIAALSDFARLAESLPPRFELRFRTEVVLSRTIRP